MVYKCVIVFDMHNLDGALFLSVSFLFLLLALSVPVTLNLPFTTIYTSLQSHKSDLNIGVLNLLFLLVEFCPPDKSFASIHFLPQTLIQLNHLITYFFYSVPFYNNCLNSFSISSLFSGGIIISSTFLEFSSGTVFGFTIVSTT